MDQMQTGGSSDNDLQQAIDNITKNANTDVFSNPVAAPSSIPEGDSGELGDPIGPFPLPDTEPRVDVVPPAPEQIAPIEPLAMPKLDIPSDDPTANNMTSNTSNASSVPNASSVSAMNMTPSAGPNVANTSSMDHSMNSAPTPMNHTVTSQDHSSMHTHPSMSADPMIAHNSMPRSHAFNGNSSPTSFKANTMEIKRAILKDLTPLLERTNADPSKKFKIYRDTMEDLHDYSVLNNAYQAASSIQNEDERADSLLYLIESIDGI